MRRFFVSVYSGVQRTLIITAAAVALVVAGVSGVDAQQAVGAADRSSVHGRVTLIDGSAVAGAQVFLLETLEAAVTDSAGRFNLTSTRHGSATLVVQASGHEDLRMAVVLPRAAMVNVVLSPRLVALEPISVSAGAYTLAGGETTMGALDVVTMAGAHADVMQAAGTTPGVQPVAEGAALYVRGGDVAETRIVLDGAVVLAPYRFESGALPFGTFDPFDLDGITFSTGGFGVRHGDALSGLLELGTRARPDRREAAVTVGISALSARAALPVGRRGGLSASANRSSTGLMFRVNGHDTDFIRVPESRNASMNASWEYRRGGRLKLYAMDEWNRFSVMLDQPSVAGALSGDDGSGLWVLSVSDVAGSTGISGSVSGSWRDQAQNHGAFRLDGRDDLLQARAEAERSIGATVTVRGGAELERRRSGMAGSYPDAAHDAGPGARVTAFDSNVTGTRAAGFGELAWRASRRLELSTGLRLDRASLPGSTTWDPRVDAVFALSDDAYLTAMWGRYHQVPAPIAYEPTVGLPELPSMSSTHHVLGLVRDGSVIVRVEAYHKRQSDLAAADRRHIIRGGGHGTATGIDVHVGGTAPFGIDARVSYSWIDAERTDPDSGVRATSPFEIPHALIVMLKRTILERFNLASTLRYSSGRPYTPVAGATRAEDREVWQPLHGAPMSARLHAYMRVDASAQLLHSFTGADLTVLFLSATNVFDRQNVSAASWNADYSQLELVQSPYRRTLYFGVSTTFPF